MTEKKTLKEIECISCQDKDTLCGGYGSKRCFKEFKAGLVDELTKRKDFYQRLANKTVQVKRQYFQGEADAYLETLLLLGVEC